MAVGQTTLQNVQAAAPTAATTSTQTTPGDLARKVADQALGRRTNGEISVAETNVGEVRDADHAPISTDRAAIKQQQGEFVAAMKARGIQASNPPTEAQLKQYFGTYNNAQDRDQALKQFEDYTTAFHVHTADVAGHRDDDVKYSPEKTYYSNGQYFGKKADAQKEARKDGNENFVGTISSAGADTWKDVDRRPGYNGRKIQDCEGFAYMSQALLGAAGYEVTHTNNQSPHDGAHNMTLLKDPDSGALAVTSNNKTFQGGDQDTLLRQGWDYASGGGKDPGTFYTGTTEARAEAAAAVAKADWK